MDDLAVLAQRPMVDLSEITWGEAITILAVGLAIVLVCLAAVVGFWFPMHRPSRRIAFIGLGVAIFLHLAPFFAFMIARLQGDGVPGIAHVVPEMLVIPLPLTVPIVVFSLRRLRRN